MTSLKTSIKTITYLSDTGCLEIQGASLGRALITLSRSDGSRLPFGAVVTEEGKKGQMPGGAGVVGDNGEVYLSGLDETGQLKVQWGRNSSCRANYRLPEEKEATGIFLVRTVCM
ncbi:hypothetical protein HV016_04165 [Escherichia coli]|nr:hypothetical protein HV016_04165 [Escherichia coli]